MGFVYDISTHAHHGYWSHSLCHLPCLPSTLATHPFLFPNSPLLLSWRSPPTSRCNGGCLLLLRFQNLVYLDNCQLCVLSLLPEIWAQHSFWMLRTNLRDELTGKLRWKKKAPHTSPGPKSLHACALMLSWPFFPPGKAHLSHIVSEVFRFPTEELVTFFFFSVPDFAALPKLAGCWYFSGNGNRGETCSGVGSTASKGKGLIVLLNLKALWRVLMVEMPEPCRCVAGCASRAVYFGGLSVWKSGYCRTSWGSWTWRNMQSADARP